MGVFQQQVKMKIKLSDEPTDCPFCGETKYYRYYIEKTLFEKEDLPYRGYCENCGKCTTPLEYQNIQEQIVADFSNDIKSLILQNSGGDYNNVEPLKMLKKGYVSAGLKENNLYKYLILHFNWLDVKMICNLYNISTHTVGDWNGAAVFYQYNEEDQRQAVKIIQYDNQTGHRITSNDNKDEAKDMLYQKPLLGERRYCLFGRHLLNRPDFKDKPICIVESEKTAIIATIIYREAIWMAAGSCYYLYNSKIDEGMSDRRIIIFPDVDVKYEPMYRMKNFERCINWYMIKNQLRDGNNVIISGFLENVLRDKCDGCPNNNICSSSPYYSPEFASFKDGEAKLESNPDLIHCPTDGPSYRGWDIADYILNTDSEQRASFYELEKPINEAYFERIKKIVNSIEKLR